MAYAGRSGSATWTKEADVEPRTATDNRHDSTDIVVAPLTGSVGVEVTGVDLDEPEVFTPRLGGLERKGAIGLVGLSEPEAMRHYVRL
ncbi:MAG TPA: hypothetical protein PLV68_04610, partial [Ilumatobacteraceae bacterium]|nr:hypothetical protein [Ilumatobacteraceae bacterium]